MIAWPEASCGRLADRGFRVIRFDNRDVGLSTKFDPAPKVDVAAAFVRAFMGQPIAAPYNLDDMAGDALGLLDALGIAKA
ncbi:alpha/beta fold hydrolase, partial [Escherichia coli]|uniref:alpha/beta fold hydrolase n=1 Tax=Escherichia coli TaxID=562 RepID=UPI003EBA32F0